MTFLTPTDARPGVARRTGRFHWPLFLVFLAASIVVTILINLLLPGWFFLGGLILFLPFFFIGGAGEGPARGASSTPACPTCGYEQRDPAEPFCPRHGVRLR